MDPLTIVIGAAGGIVLGIIGGYIVGNKNSTKEAEAAKIKAEGMIKEAELKGENIKKDRIMQAKDKISDMRSRFDSESHKRKNKLEQSEKRVKDKEITLNQKYEKIKKQDQSNDTIKENLSQQMDVIKKRQAELDKENRRQIEALEKISNLSADDARDQMMVALKDEAKTMATASIKDMVEEAKETANKQAKKIIIQTIQRTAAEHAIENTVSVFPLENDDIKGRIIGREGRNIRALEAATGIEIIVDDTPETIILSGFDPVRREIARLALHKLVQDGRIHPAKIEEIVGKTKKKIDEDIRETGERTVIELGVHGVHPELIRMIGRMKYRSSYGQNLLQHSKEVARLCATMAAELNLNTKFAKRAGLLHDIGKVPDNQPELPHALLGMEIAQKYKEHPDICNAIGAHHDEIEMTALISPLIQACDAISGSRPGARREIVESYIKRLKDLEGIALAKPGVLKSYAIQAGRELRVIVESEKVTDEQSDLLAFEISQQIQNEMQYPGQIKVTVIREKRAIAYAK